MKILFRYPNAGSQLGFNYGIAHLSAVLKEAGHEVSLWQLCEDIEPLPSQDQFLNRIRQEAADIIGFSVVTNQWPYAKSLCRTVSTTSSPIPRGHTPSSLTQLRSITRSATSETESFSN